MHIYIGILRVQLFSSLNVDLHHDKNRGFAFIRSLNGTFFSRQYCTPLKLWCFNSDEKIVFIIILIWVNVIILSMGVIPSRKCFIKAHVKWRISVYELTYLYICQQRSRWLGPECSINFFIGIGYFGMKDTILQTYFVFILCQYTTLFKKQNVI